jgi:hypothetical protein
VAARFTFQFHQRLHPDYAAGLVLILQHSNFIGLLEPRRSSDWDEPTPLRISGSAQMSNANENVRFRTARAALPLTHLAAMIARRSQYAQIDQVAMGKNN